MLAGSSDRPLGFLGYELTGGWLTFRFLVLAPEEQGRGLGSEAVLLLEAEARRRGLARRFRAQAAPDNGLVLYFWLRLGYRPLAEG
ncbi:MAG TPA: GNAT family N-acetyltransferase, partial [Dehalococcoidia bacterium]|nr:GNAT family N-acetyltransferase [Dehalococcoidia bacterium]